MNGNFSEIYVQNLLFNHDLRVLAKFGENRPLQSCRKVISYCLQKKQLRRRGHFCPPPISPSLSRSLPKFRECGRPLTYACVRLWTGCGLPDLFRKESKKVNTICFQPTTIRCSRGKPLNHFKTMRCCRGQYVYVGFYRRKIPRSSANTIAKKAIRFQHTDHNADRAQKLISSSMSDICRHATFHPDPCTRFSVILLTDRQTNAGKHIYLLFCRR